MCDDDTQEGTRSISSDECRRHQGVSSGDRGVSRAGSRGRGGAEAHASLVHY